MRYFFDGKIEKLDDIYSIHIPFNVWEVCKQRDVIQAEIILDNKIIECELLPEDKGGSFLAQKYPAQVKIVPARDKYELYDIDTPEDLVFLSSYF